MGNIYVLIIIKLFSGLTLQPYVRIDYSQKQKLTDF